MSCSNRKERTKGKEGVFASGMHVKHKYTSMYVCMYIHMYIDIKWLARMWGGGGEESKMRERKEKRNHG